MKISNLVIGINALNEENTSSLTSVELKNKDFNNKNMEDYIDIIKRTINEEFLKKVGLEEEKEEKKTNSGFDLKPAPLRGDFNQPPNRPYPGMFGI